MQLVPVLLLTALAGPQQAAPSKPPTTQELQRRQALEKLMAEVDKAEAMMNAGVRARHTHCLMAFGLKSFCDCLGEKLPVAADFPMYVRNVTTSKADLGYAKLDADWKAVVDRTLQAREACVAQLPRP